MNRFKSVFIMLFALASALVSGCKKDSTTIEPPAPVTTRYLGTIANGTESGLLSLAFPVGGGAVSGEIVRVQPTAGSIILSGTFASNVLSATGGSYTFTGVLAGGNASGGYTGPNGPGLFTAQPSTNNSVWVFAGTYTTTVTGQLSGTFNLVINGAVITGLAVSSDNQEQLSLGGTLQDSTMTIHEVTTGATLATGTLHGSSSASGTYNAGTNQGTWAGQRVQ